MRVRFWGTRGSIPVAVTPAVIRRKLVGALTRAIGRGLDTPEKVEAFVDRELDIAVGGTFGGNSSCVQLDTGGEPYVLCDLGSGARLFGNHVLAARRGAPAAYHVFMSHLHWDHIAGFPFFMPIYRPGNTITIYGCHAEMETAFRRRPQKNGRRATRSSSMTTGSAGPRPAWRQRARLATAPGSPRSNRPACALT